MLVIYFKLLGAYVYTKLNIVCHFRRVVNSPIILTDGDDDDGVYKNLDTSVNIFRENGNKLKPDTGEGASIVKHFVPSVARYGLHMIILSVQ